VLTSLVWSGLGAIRTCTWLWLQIQELTARIAKQAGLLKCQFKNLPIGDCIIASTAIINQTRIISDDLHFNAIKETKRDWI